MSMLPMLPEVPRTRLAVEALAAVVATVFCHTETDANNALLEKADWHFLLLAQSKDQADRDFGEALADWHARAV